MPVSQFLNAENLKNESSNETALKGWRLGGSTLSFRTAMALVAVLGFVVHFAFITLAKWHQAVWNDGGWYHCEADVLVHGHFFPQIGVLMFNHGSSIDCFASLSPTAAHPPLWTILLAGADLIDMKTLGWQLLLNTIVGIIAIPVVGYTAKKIGGKWLGLISAIIFTLYPGGWIETGQLTSETLGLTFSSLVILWTYKIIEKPSVTNGIFLGLWCALAALTRSELALALPLTGLFVILSKQIKLTSIKSKLKLVGIAALSFTLVMSPWLIRNNLVFTHTTLTSTELGFTLDMANCNDTYAAAPNSSFSLTSTSYEGYWTLGCALNQPHHGDESYDNSYYTSYALNYIRANISRVPLIATIRALRIWQFFDPIGQARLDFQSEQWNYPLDILKIISFYLFLPFIVISFRLMRRMRFRSFPLFVFPIITTFSVMIATEDPRYRVMSEGAISIFTAIGSLYLVDKHRVKKGKQPLIEFNEIFLKTSEITSPNSTLDKFPQVNVDNIVNPILPSRKTWIKTFTMSFLLLTTLSLSTPLLSGPDEPAAVIHAAGVARGQLVGVPQRDPSRNNTFVGSPFTAIKLPHTFDQVISYANCYAMAKNASAACAKFYGTPQKGSGYLVTYQGRYPPFYYFLVGLPTYLPMGSLTLYTLRIFSDLISAAFMASAIQAALELKKNRKYVLMGLALSITPTFLLLQSVFGSSSFESAAALCFWSSALRLVSEPGSAGRRQVIRTGLSLCCFILARPDSPLWAGLASAAILLSIGNKNSLKLLYKNSLVRLWSVLSIACVGITLTWDKLEQATNVLGYSYPPPYNWVSIFKYTFNRSLVYSAQQIGSYGEREPTLAIFLFVMLALVLIYAAFVTSTIKGKVIISVLGLMFWALPVVGSALIFPKDGFIWQGRYSLSFSLGFLMVCGYLMNSSKSDKLQRLQTLATSKRGTFAFALTLSLIVFLDIFLIMYMYMNGPLASISVGGVVNSSWKPPLTTYLTSMLLIGTIFSLLHFLGKSISRSPHHATDTLDAENTVSKN